MPTITNFGGGAGGNTIKIMSFTFRPNFSYQNYIEGDNPPEYNSSNHANSWKFLKWAKNGGDASWTQTITFLESGTYSYSATWGRNLNADKVYISAGTTRTFPSSGTSSANVLNLLVVKWD